MGIWDIFSRKEEESQAAETPVTDTGVAAAQEQSDPSPEPEKPKKTGPVTGEAIPAELRAAMAVLKGREPSNDPVPEVNLDELFPIGSAIEKRRIAEEEARRKAEEEALKNPQIGQEIEGKGVFVGTWTPKDRDGNSLNKTFNLFAAPEDLTDSPTNAGGKKALRTLKKTVAHVADLKGWHGHDGFNHNVRGKSEDEALYDALRDGSYNGEWFIPTKDIVHGKDIDGNQVQADNLYAHKDKGALQGTFTTASGSDSALWYLSCTQHRELASGVYVVAFTVGFGGWDHKAHSSLSGRVVRAELRP